MQARSSPLGPALDRAPGDSKAEQTRAGVPGGHSSAEAMQRKERRPIQWTGPGGWHFMILKTGVISKIHFSFLHRALWNGTPEGRVDLRQQRPAGL